MSRLFLRTAAGMLLVLAVTFLVFRWGMQTTIQTHFQRVFPVLLANIELARRQVERTSAHQLPATLAQLRHRIGHPVRLVDRGAAEITSEIHEALMDNSPFFISHQSDPGRMVFIPVRGGDKLLVIGPLGTTLGGSNFPFVVLGLVVISMVALTGILLVVPLVRRLAALGRAAKKISEGDLLARAPISSNDAIGSLAQQFNIMADRVRTLLEQQRGLIQAVSHELRTPVARIRFSLELLSEATEESQREKRINAIDEDLGELDALIEELVLYVRLGEGALKMSYASLDAADLTRTLCTRLVELRPEIAVSVEPSDDTIILSADEKYFKRAIGNLVSNAIRHAKQHVSVQLQQRGDAVVVSISDDGPGVPAEHREAIFDAFARLDNSRTRESGGVGLGLAIVKRIMTAHGGGVTVTDAASGGACFVTAWPRSTF